MRGTPCEGAAFLRGSPPSSNFESSLCGEIPAEPEELCLFSRVKYVLESLHSTKSDRGSKAEGGFSSKAWGGFCVWLEERL